MGFIDRMMVLGFVAGVIGMVIAIVAAMRAKKKYFMKSLARRLQGQFFPASHGSFPRIQFSMSGRESVVEFVAPGEDHRGRTRVIVPLQGVSPGTLHILRRGFGQSFLKMFGAQDLSTGDREFDARYVVRATPESLAVQVFASPLRTRVIAAVRRLESLANPTIELTQDQLRLVVRVELKHEDGLLALVKTAEEFLEFLPRESHAMGIEFEEVKVALDSNCPVCGTRVGSSAVRCESCKTPHHAECWTYVGQCSTYACRGIRWVA